MKKQIIILAAIVLFTTYGCEKIDKLTHFTIPISQSVNLPIIPQVALGVAVEQSFTTATDIESKLAQFKTSSDLIEKVYLKSLDLELTNPDNGNLDFIETVEVSISADGLPKKKIASKTGLSAPIGKKLTLDAENVDLKEYILKDPVTIYVKMKVDQVTVSEYTVLVSAGFVVDAKILGI